MSQLGRARVYRNIDLRQEWLGLEPFDALSLAASAWLLMVANRDGLLANVLILAVAYVGLRVFKRGKPEGYSILLVRFYLRRPFFSAAERDSRLAGRPFPFATNPERTRP